MIRTWNTQRYHTPSLCYGNASWRYVSPQPLAHMICSGAYVDEEERGQQRTALRHAVLVAARETTAMLLSSGAYVDMRGSARRTSPLYEAIVTTRLAFGTRSRLEIVCILLAGGADVNARAANGQTPIYAAARRGLTVIVSMLLRLGADSTIRTPRGVLPFDVAVSYRHFEAAELLLPYLPLGYQMSRTRRRALLQRSELLQLAPRLAAWLGAPARSSSGAIPNVDR